MDIHTIQQPNKWKATTTTKNISIVVPYIHALGERFRKTCNNLGNQVHFRGTNTIKTLLMAPKDRFNKLQKNGLIHGLKCPHNNCLEKYIGESGRSFRDQLKEHLRAPSSIHQHSHSLGDPVNPSHFTIVNRESQGYTMNINEAMYKKVNGPSLNRNLDKHQLPHI